MSEDMCSEHCVMTGHEQRAFLISMWGGFTCFVVPSMALLSSKQHALRICIQAPICQSATSLSKGSSQAPSHVPSP